MTDVIFELPRDAAEALCSSANLRPSGGLIYLSSTANIVAMELTNKREHSKVQ